MKLDREQIAAATAPFIIEVTLSSRFRHHSALVEQAVPLCQRFPLVPHSVCMFVAPNLSFGALLFSGALGGSPP